LKSQEETWSQVLNREFTLKEEKGTLLFFVEECFPRVASPLGFEKFLSFSISSS
jgi:hypothetical protein